MTAYAFRGRAVGATACSCCNRPLRYLYRLEGPAGVVVMGRRCAARAMGWPTNSVEAEAARLEWMAVRDARMAVVVAAFPDLAATAAREAEAAAERRAAGYAVNAVGTATSLLSTAVVSDCWWGGPGWAGYATWEEYLAAHAG